MVGAIIVLAIEFTLMGLAGLMYFGSYIGWILGGCYLILALIAGLMLPKGIKGIKTRNPSRGKAIATTAIAGTAVFVGIIYAITLSVLAGVFDIIFPMFF